MMKTIQITMMTMLALMLLTGAALAASPPFESKSTCGAAFFNSSTCKGAFNPGVNTTVTLPPTAFWITRPLPSRPV